MKTDEQIKEDIANLISEYTKTDAPILLEYLSMEGLIKICMFLLDYRIKTHNESLESIHHSIQLRFLK